MKTKLKSLIAMAIIGCTFTACNKDKKSTPVGPLGANYPEILNTIITPAILDSLESHGTIINAGLTPATVNGIYLISPLYCQYDNSGDGYMGRTIDNYEYKYSNQNNTNFSIDLNYSDKTGGGNDVGSDSTATYISGSNNLFTTYAQTTGIDTGIPYTSLQVISGQVTTGGINNFQLSFYLVSKGSDPTNVLASVGTIRIFKDDDGISPTQATFSSLPGSKTPVFALRNVKQAESLKK